MKVRSLLEAKGTEVMTVRPEVSVAAALRKLVLEHIGALVVSEDGIHVEGMLSERDIVRGLVEEGAQLLTPGRRVSDIMSRQVRTCSPEDDLKHVMNIMTHHRVRHLPVVEGARLAGIVSIGDVVKSRLEEMELEANVLRDAYIASH